MNKSQSAKLPYRINKTSLQGKQISLRLRAGQANLKRELIVNLIDKKILFHQLPKEMSEREKAEIRREALEKVCKADLSGLGGYVFDPEVAGKRNCENMIGGISIPLGIAGPLIVKGKFAKGSFYIPLATTEGALVASVNRGCKAITLAGGVETVVEDVGITRAPVFKLVQSAKLKVQSQQEFVKWVKTNYQQIEKITETTSHHLKLLKIEPFIEEDAVFLRFSFNTGLAMGMNMATIATASACEFIEQETGAELIALSGNVCCDKKASKLNFERGRGKKVTAKVILSKIILHEVLKTTAKDLYRVYRLKIVLGSKVAGTIGANAQMANIIAGIFAATGQDLAHAVEGAIGKTECILTKNEGVEIMVYMPDLPIGVIGGGTGLTTQKECLGILGCLPHFALQGRASRGKRESGSDSLKLAEIIGGTVLAGEISLLSALAANDLAKAHQKLGRGK